MHKLILIDNKYWMDNYGNRWNSNQYTKDEAIAASNTLVDCVGCTDCSYCTDCIHCNNCTNCTGCICCEDCTDCIDNEYSLTNHEQDVNVAHIW